MLNWVMLFEFLISCWQRSFLIVNNGNFDPLKSQIKTGHIKFSSHLTDNIGPSRLQRPSI